MTNKEIFNNETTQYITTLIVSVYACFCMYNFYFFDKDIKWINYLFIIVLIYLTIHLYFVDKIELKIHHVLFIFVISWYFLCIDIGPVIKTELFIFSLAEVSNIFLSIRNLIRDPSVIQFIPQFVSLSSFIQPINDVLFSMTFFYARIYLYFKYIITNQEFLETIRKYNKYFMCDKIVIAIFFGLFILNLYWFGLILNGVFKMIGLDKVVKSILANADDSAFLRQIDAIKVALKG